MSLRIKAQVPRCIWGTPIMMPKTLLRLRCALLKVKRPHIMIKLASKNPSRTVEKMAGEAELCSNYTHQEEL